MKSTVLSLVSCLAASAAMLLGSRPAMAADFSKAGSVSVAVERTFGIHYVSNHYDFNPGTNTDGGTTIGFGWSAAGSPLHYARAAVDVFVIDRLSVGGSLGFFTQTGDANFAADGVLLAPRVGYAIELSKIFTFWPRGGFTFLKFDNSSLFGLNAEAMFVAWPRPNWGVLLGATLDIDFTGKYADNVDWSQFSLGIPSIGLIVTF